MRKTEKNWMEMLQNGRKVNTALYLGLPKRHCLLSTVFI